jgi:hypothetical protein
MASLTGRRENLTDKLFTQLSALVVVLGSAGLKKQSDHGENL